MKQVSCFPASCITFRRGKCRECNAEVHRNKTTLEKKRESARTRFGSMRGFALEDVKRLFELCGVDTTDEDTMRRAYIARADDSRPFDIWNATVRVMPPARRQTACA